ncbi:hypothetical protein CHEID_05600 [Corynebacterium heidelbergense]|nr:DUF3000 domain-containing protein [Corynebacterium heidelbergense]WCZ36657.1 hypothetical protein CHEID_05600 [Corynebacterium heidelbergense]
MSRDHETTQSPAPDYFADAVKSMTDTAVRPGIELSNIRPPRNLAPLSHAIGLEVQRGHGGAEVVRAVPEFSDPDAGGDAFGRLILLHDPQGEDQWDGAKMRLVAYIQADMDASVAGDPLLPDVAWDWLTEELEGPAVAHTDLGGTVTSTASVRYGQIGGPPRAFQLEMRASWTATGTDLSGHVQAFARVLAKVAGLPPEGVATLSSSGARGSRVPRATGS